MTNVCNEEALIPCLGALDADRLAPLGVLLFVVDTQKDALRVCKVANQLAVDGCIFSLILHETLGGIGTRVEIEVGKEVVVGKIVFEDVRAGPISLCECAGGSAQRCGQKCRRTHDVRS